MGHAYTAVQWNRQKMFYDGVLLIGVALYVGGFIWLTPELDPNAESWDVRMRAYGSAAFILHCTLSRRSALSAASTRGSCRCFTTAGTWE